MINIAVDKSGQAFIRFAVLLILLSAFVATAEASTLIIGVKKSTSDEYITGAKVCVGSSSSAYMYGVVYTGSANQPLPSFEVPSNVQAVEVTVTKEGYQGLRQTVNLSRSGQNVTRQISLRLSEGTGGPTCNAVPGPSSSSPVSPPSIPRIPIAITSFRINDGQSSTTDRIVRIDFTYGGTPTHYQLSESSDFSDAPWKELIVSGSGGGHLTYNFDEYVINTPVSTPSNRRTRPVTDGPLRPVQVIRKPSAQKYGTRTLYFRLKNAEFSSGKRNDSIELKPVLKRYFVSGGELKELVSFARDQGFTFNSSLTEGGNDDPCFIPSQNEFAGPRGFREGLDFDQMAVRVMAHAQCDMGLGTATVLIFPKKLRTTFFGGRNLNTHWRIRGNPVFEKGELWNEAASDSKWTITKRPADNDPSFAVEFSFTRKPRREPVPTYTVIALCQSGFCNPASIKFLILELEGPEDDNWIDPNKKWKNAFLQP